MKIEDLLDCSADELEAMTDEQLRAYLEPYFNVTRPEIAGRAVTNTVQAAKAAQTKKFNAQLDELKQKAGIDLSWMKNSKWSKKK